MTPSEYIDRAKEVLGIESDYELAKRFEIPKQYVSAYRNGKRTVDNYTAMRLAITLDMDLAEVIADLESQHEKNDKRREFFRGFLQKHAGVAHHLSFIGLLIAVSMQVEKVLQLAQLST